MNTPTEIIVITFYKFVRLDNCHRLQQSLLTLCQNHDIRGTILIAKEGINATVSGKRHNVNALLDYLNEDCRFIGLELKESVSPDFPFHRMKVRLKKEIVTMGVPDISPNRLSGVRVAPKDWNSLIEDPEVTVIDTRNKYECDVGMFRNAISPGTDSFSEFPQYVERGLHPEKHRKIAMYCTGGIRCEKASALLLERGFGEVYQLHGGILKYLEEIEAEQNLWDGECFVFDGRVALNSTLRPGEYELCYACRTPLSTNDRKSGQYEEGISCPRCFGTLTDERRESLQERQHQVKLAKEKNRQHIGARLTPDTGK